VTHVLAIDLGTGIPGVPGSQVFDTEAGWRLVGECIGDALASAGLTGRDIAAVSSTSMREGMVLYDAAGREIWACPNVDSRAGAEATELVRTGGARQIFERGGDWVSITSPARFVWIREHEPEIFRAIAHVGMLSDWVLTRLTGRYATDPSCGSSSGLFDLPRRDWSRESLALIGVPPDVMPQVLEPGMVMGEVSLEASRATGLAAGTPVVVGGGDTQLGLVGIGGTRPGRLTLLGGSFWQLTVVTDQPLIDPQARVRTLCHAVPGQWMTEGIAFYGGMAMRWLRDAMCDPERAEATRRGVDAYVVMEEEAAAVPAGANGLLAIFSNVMDVKRWVQAPPSFVGFDVGDPSRTDRRACIRSVQEQAAFASRGHLAIIEELTGHAVDSIVFTGGAAKGKLWPRIVADVLGVTVQVPEVKESTALGAAMLAGVGVGLHPDLDTVARSIARFERTIEPDAAAMVAYDDAFARWSAVYPRMLALAEDGLATTSRSIRCPKPTAVSASSSTPISRRATRPSI
jgi:autoinducer 2 (AI-2) kinase